MFKLPNFYALTIVDNKLKEILFRVTVLGLHYWQTKLTVTINEFRLPQFVNFTQNTICVCLIQFKLMYFYSIHVIVCSKT